jgi:hypothetical protein
MGDYIICFMRITALAICSRPAGVYTTNENAVTIVTEEYNLDGVPFWEKNNVKNLLRTGF